MRHHHLSTSATTHEWRVEHALPFNELLLSWNGARPSRGHFVFEVSVFHNESWTPWLETARWGADGQRGSVIKTERLSVDQDTVELPTGLLANGFAVRVRAENGATLSTLRILHACTSAKPLALSAKHFDAPSIALDVPGLSQMALQDPRGPRLCSPASLTAVVRALTGRAVDPLCLSTQAWDSGSDIFGNWSLNVAAASGELGSEWSCWVERLSGFGALYERLQAKTPVVISVRGPLVGSAQPYVSGHLMVVRGWDRERQEVLCMDPAFESDAATLVRYPLQDLVTAWERRGRVAYVVSALDHG